MLTDAVLKRLKPKDKPYKIQDRDGMYAAVSKTGLVTFRLNYRIRDRRETLTIGRYGPGGLTLAMARERCLEARKLIAEGVSPAKEKRRNKDKLKEAEGFKAFALRWIEEADLAQSTRAMRKTILVRDIIPAFAKYRMDEILPDDLRALCNKVKKRGAPATALHVRDIVKQIYAFARLHGAKYENPADEVAPKSIATIVSRDRSLSPGEIRLLYRVLDSVTASPTLKLGIKFILLTMKRKSEVAFATWDEINFETGEWVIPKVRMKTSQPHVVFLSQQAIDILIALKTCAGGSRFLFPARYDPDRPISNATFNRITDAVAKEARKQGLPLEPFTVHDLRRTGSTLLNEMGFNRDWIEKCLAHEDSNSSRGVYNRAQYAAQRRHMLQEWADLIDAWSRGEKRTPKLQPDVEEGYTPDPTII